MRGFALVCEASAEGFRPALFRVARCYLRGKGVRKDAAHGVSLLRELARADDAVTSKAQAALALCYMDGEGVETDTVQAALWCQRAADGGDAEATQMLPMIRMCDSCGATPARQHCKRCRTVRYCNAVCQAGHWNHETHPHKGHCRGRRAAEASQDGEDTWKC